MALEQIDISQCSSYDEHLDGPRPERANPPLHGPFFVVGKQGRTCVESSQFEKLAIGGTATVYVIRKGEYQGHILKIYKPDELVKRRDRLFKKIEAMMTRPPRDLLIEIDGTLRPQYSWPEAFVEDKDEKPCGFLAPFFDKNNDEHYVLKSYIYDVGALDRKNQGIKGRVAVARNIASALHSLHEAGHFFVDLKPDNIMVHRESGAVALLDTDGFSISCGEFPAEQTTDDYVAPEFIGKSAVECSATPVQDDYALALLMFLILDFRNGPWDCNIDDKVLLGDDEDHSIESRASRGLYAYGKSPVKGLRPKEKSIFRYWPEPIRDLFDRAFVVTRVGQRPSPHEWIGALDAVEFEQCEGGVLKEFHRYFKGKGCFVCEVFEAPGITTEDAEPAPEAPHVEVPKGPGATHTDPGRTTEQVSEPEAPTHWTDYLPDGYGRLRAMHTKLKEAQDKVKASELLGGASAVVQPKAAQRRRLPLVINPVVGLWQFLWFFAHGLTGAGLAASGGFLFLAALAIWNPEFLPVCLIALFLMAGALSSVSDYLLYMRVDGLVAKAGGFENITPSKLLTWLRPRQEGWFLGPVVVVLLIGLVVARFAQIEAIRSDADRAIQSVSSLQDCLSVCMAAEVKAGRTPSTAKCMVPEACGLQNDEVGVEPVANNLLLTFRRPRALEGKNVYMKPQWQNGAVVWRCGRGSGLPEYLAPPSCSQVFVD